MINETRERFIRDIAERLDPARIMELHFFPSIRQGPIETGVAVIAATPVPVLAGAASEPVGAAVVAEEPPPELALESEPPVSDEHSEGTTERAEVFTATYVWTRKGPDRGKWVVEVITEAHAPLTTVETVVRGVQDRAGEALDAYRMSADDVRALLGISDVEAAAEEDLAAATTGSPDAPAA